MAARLGITRFALYLRIKKGKVPAFRALYRSGLLRILVDHGGAPRPLPQFHGREPDGVPWVEPSEVANTLRVSTRLVQAACLQGVFEAWRSPGARRRARFGIAIDEATRLPLPKGTLVPASRP